MNIKQLIADLRARVNPQYYDQIGTESYERHQVVKALEYLATENEPVAWLCGADVAQNKDYAEWFTAFTKESAIPLYARPVPAALVLELIAEIERVTKQRDELLAALKDAREMVSDWAGYASPYFQEKHDIDGDLKKLDDAIARMEG